ncbi:MAG: FkbM family methyltransferase [Opitutaceae bacterium]|nr:FkbM family methyltransferase [Opitutaceae bacterium]
MTTLEEIHAFLAEPVAAAAERERRTFPALLAGTDGSVVLFGAGRLGRLCARALRRGGVTLHAFCDRNPQLHGDTVEGAVVMSPEEAAHRFGTSALFVVSIWTGTARESMAERMDFLRRLGCRFVANYAALVWAHGRAETPFHSFDLPSRVLENAPALRDLARLLSDQTSLQTLLAALRQRLHGEFDSAPPAADQYFPREVVALRADEIFVDGGAFTGDTLDAFLEHTGPAFRAYHAFEPDHANAEELRRRVAGLPEPVRPKISVHEVALHARNELLDFSAEGSPTSKIVPRGGSSVPGRTLDSLFSDQPVTFLKLDVEGAEQDALRGARSVISRDRPLTAVCVYHGPRDLWEIPLMLRELLPEHRFFLRQHQFDGYELVVYAIPPDRDVR